MSIDAISPIAPACVRALLLPVGKIKRSEFSTGVDRLRSANRVRLGDISFDTQSGKKTFSPQAFPNGVIVYNITTAASTNSHPGLWPFEAFREPSVILGIADANEYEGFKDVDAQSNAGQELREYLNRDLEALRDKFPRALVVNLLIFNAIKNESTSKVPRDVSLVPPIHQSKTTTISTLMCDLSALLLIEMSSLAEAIQEWSTIESPSTVFRGRSSMMMLQRENAEESSRRDSMGSNTSRPETPPSLDNGATHPQSSSARLSRQDLSRSESPTASTVDLSRQAAQMNGHGETGRDSPSERTSRIERPSSRLASSPPSSKDRKSVSAAGLSGTAERAKSKLKARQCLVTGALYLHAGRWPDALRELVDGTTRAKAFSDHLWHAKGLENILATMIVLAWAGLEFQIPLVCHANTERFSHSRSSSAAGTYSGLDVRTSSDGSNTRTVQALSAQAVDLCFMIVNIYGRAAAQPGEAPPQISFSQCCLRLANLLSLMHRFGGQLNHQALHALVSNVFASANPRSVIQETVGLRYLRSEISSLIFRGYPSKPALAVISVQDTVTILSGMASALSFAGLQRKQAIVVRDLLSTLIPAIIQARKLGAAEVGIHPAAGMALLQQVGEDICSWDVLTHRRRNTKDSFHEVLVLICRNFGIKDIPSYEKSDPHAANLVPTSEENLQSKGEREVLAQTADPSFGGRNLKIDILRLCMNFSEAMSHLEDVLIFSAALLRNACLASNPVHPSLSDTIALPKEEQARVINKIYRGFKGSEQKTSNSFEVDYWDDFFVRNIEASEPTKDSILVKHSKSEFAVKSEVPGSPSSSMNTQSGPFLHNPFARAYGNIEEQPTFIAGEKSTVWITIQNLYDFDLIIEKIQIVADGVPFHQEPMSLIVGPRKFEGINIIITPEKSGELKVSGCLAKIQGCEEREFSIARQSRMKEDEPRLKHIGLPRFSHISQAASNQASEEGDESEGAHENVATQSLTKIFRVLNDQPLLKISSTSLSQSTVSLLDGESLSFSLVVHNTSDRVEANFLHLSFLDSLRPSLHTSSRGRLSAFELYEIELLEATRQPFTWRRTDRSDSVIQPGSFATFEVVVFGRPGLSECLIQLDYASLDRPFNEISNTFYSRRISIPLVVTVNASTQLQRIDVLPIHEAFSIKSANDTTRSQSEDVGPTHSREENSAFILLLDLRNVWPQPLIVYFNVGEMQYDQNAENGDNARTSTTQMTIQPGQIKRIALLLPKLWVANPQAPIPSFNAANKVQFVVNKDNLLSEGGVVSPEAFWYREELLKHVSGRWEEVESDRHGLIDMRSIRLNPRMIQIVRKDEVKLDVEVLNDDDDVAGVNMLASGVFLVQKLQLLTLKATIRNITPHSLQGQLRFRPKSSQVTDGFDVDLTRSIAWTGLLRQPLQTLGAGEEIQRFIGLSMLCTGQYEIAISAESLTIANEHKSSSDSHNGDHEARVLGTSFITLIVDEASNATGIE